MLMYITADIDEMFYADKCFEQTSFEQTAFKQES